MYTNVYFNHKNIENGKESIIHIKEYKFNKKKRKLCLEKQKFNSYIHFIIYCHKK